MSDLEYMPIDCKSISGLRAIALMLSNEIVFEWLHECRIRCEKIVFIFVRVKLYYIVAIF